jgi:hypothetical protein
MFAAWLTIWSMATNVKSIHMISTMGRRPVIAAPTAAPSMAVSLIGVSNTRSRPEFCVQVLRDTEDPVCLSRHLRRTAPCPRISSSARVPTRN